MGYGIDIGTTALKVVDAQRTLGGFRIAAAVRRRIPRGAPEQQKAALLKLLHGALAASNGRRVGVVGLSGRDINLQIVQQPQMRPLNYRMMMNYEMEQRQGGASDLYMDYCTLREPDSYYPQYLALIGMGKSSYVDDRVGLLARAGLDVRDAIPNAFALHAVHRNSYGAEGGTVMILDLGSDNMDIAFVRGGRLIFARNVSSGARIFDGNIAGMTGVSAEEAEALKIAHGNLGPQADVDEESPAGRVHAPIRAAAGQMIGFITSSINHAKVQLNEKDFTVDKIYLSGGGARLRGLNDYLAGAARIPVEILDPFRRVDVSSVRGAGAEDFKQLPSDMAVAIGLAQLGSPSIGTATLSILPPPLKKRRNFFRTTFWMWVAGGILLATLAFLTVLAAAHKGAQESALEDFKRQTAERSRRLQEMEALEQGQRESSAKVDYLLSHAATARGTLDVVSKLRKVLPRQGMTIRQMRFTEGGRAAAYGLGVERHRTGFLYHGRGLVIGEVESESDGKIRIKGEAEPFEVALVQGGAAGLLRWPVAARSLLVVGEADENIRGGPREALNTLLRDLEDKSRNITARLQKQNPSPDKPGWRVFEILVTFE